MMCVNITGDGHLRNACTEDVSNTGLFEKASTGTARIRIPVSGLHSKNLLKSSYYQGGVMEMVVTGKI